MKKNIYPTTLEFHQDIKGGIASSTEITELIDSRNAISLKININRNDYQVADIKCALKELFEKVYLCFHE